MSGAATPTAAWQAKQQQEICAYRFDVPQTPTDYSSTGPYVKRNGPPCPIGTNGRPVDDVEGFWGDTSDPTTLLITGVIVAVFVLFCASR